MKSGMRSLFGILLLTLVLAACAGRGPATSTNAPDAAQAPSEEHATAQAPTAEESAAENVAFAAKKAPIFREKLTDETIELRFYDDAPSVAYVNMADFYKLMLPSGSMDVAKQDDGTYLLTSDTGASPNNDMGTGLGGTAVVDVNAGTLTSPNLPAFTNVMSLLQEGMDNVYYDGAPYVRVSRVEYDVDPKPVTLDFGHYGIAVHADDEGVYLPFQTIAAIYSDLANNIASYNGKNVYVENELFYEKMTERDPDYYDPLFTEKTRPKDMAEFSYAHLRFCIDNFYGVPSRTANVLGNHDIDATLESMGETGKAIKEGLLSTDLAESLVATEALGLLLWDGGHSYVSYAQAMQNLGNEKAWLVDAYNAIKEDVTNPLGAFISSNNSIEKFYENINVHEAARSATYGDKTYIKKGDTAVIVFDSFTTNDAWVDYLKGDCERPGIDDTIEHGMFKGERDTLAVVTKGLEKAAADPEIKNVVLDISNNTGGSLDTLAYISSLVSGRDSFRYQNTLTGQVILEHYDVDRNLDGCFDAHDKEVSYDNLRFAVVTSQASFSCGSLLASALAEDGIMIMGERAGGGSCAVQQSVTADGWEWVHSSFRARLVDATGHDIDSGVPVDVNLIELGDAKSAKTLEEKLSNLYDVQLLSNTMNKYYGKRKISLPKTA